MGFPACVHSKLEWDNYHVHEIIRNVVWDDFTSIPQKGFGTGTSRRSDHIIPLLPFFRPGQCPADIYFELKWFKKRARRDHIGSK